MISNSHFHFLFEQDENIKLKGKIDEMLILQSSGNQRGNRSEKPNNSKVGGGELVVHFCVSVFPQLFSFRHEPVMKHELCCRVSLCAGTNS